MKRITVALATLAPVAAMAVTQFPGVKVDSMALRDNGIANAEFVDSSNADVTFSEGCDLSNRGVMISPLQVSTFISAYMARFAAVSESADEPTVQVTVDGCTNSGDPQGNTAAKIINIKLESLTP